MRNTVFIPIRMINEANECGWMRSLGYFVKLKSLWYNNTDYNYSLRKLSSKIGCSSSGLHLHIKRLEQLGLITFHCGNITFLGYGKLQKKYGGKFIGVPVTDIKKQLLYLRGQIIRFNLSQQEYRIKKAGLQKITNGYVPFKQKGKALMRYTGISADGVGCLFGLSIASGSRIRRKLANEGLVKTKRRYHLFHKDVCYRGYLAGKYEGDIPQYAFFKDGNIVIERVMQMEYVGRLLGD